MENKKVLEVKDLRINFSTDHGYVQAVRGVSFDLYKGETLCIVGESGSGKSVTSKAIMGILAANGRIVSGSIMYDGEDLTKVSEDEFHRIRGHKIGMIFQDPLSSLNPIMRIGKQITEAMLINSSHLKRKFNDLVSDELVAYKNAQTEYNSAISKYKENIRFLTSERKKELAKAKNMAANETEGREYSLKQAYGGEVYKTKEQLTSDINLLKQKLENSEITNEEFTSKTKELTEKTNSKLADLKKKYNSDKANISNEVESIKKSTKERVEQIKNEFNTKIREAKEEARSSKAPLKEKYLPLIKETKAVYKAKAKVAKGEVKKYKEELKQTFKDKKASILRSSSSHKALDIKKAKAEYISSIRITKAEAKAKALKIMEEVGIPYPERRYRQYPFEFSGGMRQRIVIAIALTADPDILICDEPTTALDVTIQAQILELINRLKKERNLSCIFITHDLGVVANMADRVAVMYAGKIVEYGTEDEIFYDPRHPYTWALLSSIPDIDSNEKLEAIPGTPPNMIYPPVGDAFALRSKYAMAIDFKKEPPLFKVSDTHYAATWLLDPRAPKVEMPKIVKTRIENSLKAKKGGKK